MLGQMTRNQTEPQHDLSPLLTHPDFRQGVADAQDCFLCDYAPEPLSEDEMIYEVEVCISRKAVEQSKSVEIPPYFYWLGYVYGIVSVGLAYAANSSSDVDLSALMEHPDFLPGVDEAQECFLEYYAAAPLTEDEMVEEVERNLGRAYQQSASLASGNYCDHPSYIHHLGFVFGIINQGLSAAIAVH